MNPTESRERLSRYIYKTQTSNNPLGLLQEALILSTMAEGLEKRIRVEGVKTGRVTALDLPGQISAGRAARDLDCEPRRRFCAITTPRCRI
jgi:acyl-CoA dehydrogenase